MQQKQTTKTQTTTQHNKHNTKTQQKKHTYTTNKHIKNTNQNK